MKKSWLPFAALLLLIIVLLGIFFVLPRVSGAPTIAGPGAAVISTAEDAASSTPGAASIADLITVNAPLLDATVSSPIAISGTARGSWYFEATAPVILEDSSGTVIAHGTIRAQGDWTSSDYVPFVGSLSFTAPATQTGTLVLMNDNPSGDPSKQKELDISVMF